MAFRGHCQKEGEKILQNKLPLVIEIFNNISHHTCSLLTFDRLLGQTGGIRPMKVQLSKALKKCKPKSKSSPAHIA